MRYVKQRISYADKIKDDYEWAKEVIDSLEIQADSYMGVRDRIKMMERAYELYGNQVHQEDIENVFNPLNVDVGQKRDKIHAYNKAHNKINTLIGEMLKRPNNYKNFLISAERAVAVEKEKAKLMQEFLVSQINKKAELENLNMQEGMGEEEIQQAVQEIEEKYAQVLGPDQIDEYLKNEYLEPVEMKANLILDDINVRHKIKELKADGFKHGLLSGEEHVWVGQRHGKLVIDVLNPLFVFYHKSPETKYIQDGDYAGVKYKMSIGEVFDTFDLTDDQIKELEDKYLDGHTSATLSNKMKYHFDNTDYSLRKQMISGSTADRHRGSYGYAYEDMVDIMHVEWRSQTKIGILTFLNEEGELDSTIVSEDFKMDKKDPNMVGIEWVWVDEIWEGTKIDDIYTNISPIPNQETTLENVHSKKLRYHGHIYENMNTTQISMMERMRPFQYLYLIIMHNLKKLIATDRGRLVVMDTSQMDSEFGTEKTMYYMQELNIMPINSLAHEEGEELGNLSRRGGPIQSIDRSQSQNIANYISLLEYIDNQIGEVAGISRSREGQTGRYETATNAQQSIIQSSNITEMLFFTHNKLWERILEKAINVETKIKKSGYHTLMSSSMGKTRNLVVNEEEFSNVDFQVFLTDSPEDNEVFNQIKMLYSPLLQSNQAKFSQVIKLIRQKSSLETLIRDIEEFENLTMQQEQQRMQMEQQQAQMAMEAKQAEVAQQLQHEKELKAMDVEAKIRVAEIQAMSFNENKDANNNNVLDVLEVEKLRHSIEKDNRTLDLKEKELAQRSEEAKKSAELKEKEIKQKNSGSK